MFENGWWEGAASPTSPLDMRLPAQTTMSLEPALGVSVKSVRLVAGKLGFYSQSSHTEDFKNSICSFCAWRSTQVKVRRVLCIYVLFIMYVP